MKPSQTELEPCLSPEWLESTGDELRCLVARPLPDEVRSVRSFHALCLRRDIAALRRVKPDFGVSDVPGGLRQHRRFDRVMGDALDVLDRRMSALSAGLGFNVLYGAWEGGMPVAEAPTTEVGSRALPVVISAFNVRGALCRDSGMEAHDANILSLCASLNSKGCIVAVLGEPRFAPGLVWPDWSGYKLLGERVSSSGSVAVLVLAEVVNEVREVEGVGEARAIWLEMQWAKPKRHTSQRNGLLVLGVYAPQVGHATETRRHFWLERHREYMVLKRRPKYHGWEVLVVGDFNLHFKFLGTANARYEKALDREVLAMLQDPAGFGCSIGNPPGVQTHSSGTIIDVVAGSCQ